MSGKRQEPGVRPAAEHQQAHEGPQQAVAKARAQVMGGRGSGAGKAETDRYKRERPTLGPLPAPLERELVHLNTMRIRLGEAEDVDTTDLRNQIDRVREVWDSKPAWHARSVAAERAREKPIPITPALRAGAERKLGVAATAAAIALGITRTIRLGRRRS